MSLKKVCLYGATLSVAILGSASAMAEIEYDERALFPSIYAPLNATNGAPAIPAAPKFPFVNAERGAICLAEALLSTVASQISVTGCAGFAGGTGSSTLEVPPGSGKTGSVAKFQVTVDVKPDGAGTLKMTGGVGGITNIEIDNVMVDSKFTQRGIKCQLSSPKNSGQYQIQGLAFNGFEGLMTWNKNNTILVGAADRIGIGHDWYAESIIKDFYAVDAAANVGLEMADGTLLAAIPENTNADWGLEAIMKHPSAEEANNDLGFPRSKWWQQSLHWNANGVIGGTHMIKTRLVPSACTMELNLWGADFASGFNEKGMLRVTTLLPQVPGAGGDNGLPLP